MTPRREPPERGGLTPRLVLAAVVTGAAAGLLAIALSLLLRVTQHAAFHYSSGRFYTGVAGASDLRRLVAVTLAGLVASLCWWGLSRARGANARVDVEAALAGRPLPLQEGLAGAVLQIVTVGLGAPLGREGAPREAGAAAGEVVSRWLGLTRGQRRLMLAAGSAAGLAAVYNVPVGGTILALEVLLRSRRLRDLVVAAICSAVATGVSFLGLPDQATYQVPRLHVTASLCVFAVLIGPPAGLLSIFFARTMARARRRASSGRRSVVTATVVAAAIGGLSAWQPQLLGNGKGPVQLALDHALPASPLLALLFLRPVVTAATLRTGLVGGLLTPALASGALLGALTGAAWNFFWPGTAFAACVLVTAAAFLGGAQRSPLTALALGLELTGTGLPLLLPLALAMLGATAFSRPLMAGAAP